MKQNTGRKLLGVLLALRRGDGSRLFLVREYF